MTYIDVSFDADASADWRDNYPTAVQWAWIDDAQFGGWSDNDADAFRAKLRDVLTEERAPQQWDLSLDGLMSQLVIEWRDDPRSCHT